VKPNDRQKYARTVVSERLRLFFSQLREQLASTTDEFRRGVEAKIDGGKVTIETADVELDLGNTACVSCPIFSFMPSAVAFDKRGGYGRYDGSPTTRTCPFSGELHGRPCLSGYR